MSAKLFWVLLVALICYFIIIFHLLNKHKMDLKYSLVWFLVGICLLILILVPDLLGKLADLIGVSTGMNTLYLCLIAFIFLLLLSLTSITSSQKERIRKLTEENGILEKRVHDLELQVNGLQCNKNNDQG